jgi:hypothetical protein
MQVHDGNSLECADFCNSTGSLSARPLIYLLRKQCAGQRFRPAPEDNDMNGLAKKLMGTVLGAGMLMSAAGPLVSHADAQRYDRRGGYYRDSHGHRHRRHGGIGPGKGALIGGAAGTGIGALVGGGKGALIGGAVGAGGGALAGKANADHRHNDARRYDEYRRY